MTSSIPTRPFLDQSTVDLAGSSWQVEVVPELDSTNAEVGRRVRADAGEGLVLVAEHQTAGRGRLDRVWEAPARSGLTFSVLLRPDEVPAERWGWLPLLTGVAVAEGVEAAGGPGCTLKWPNDIHLDGRKLGGLLVERVESGAGPAAVVGIGLNVSLTADELPIPEATSLALAGAEVDRAALLSAVLKALAGRYRDWVAAAGRPGGLRDAYRARCSTLGLEVRATLPGGEVVQGVAEEVAEDGALVLATARGRVEVRAGDVVHVRPN